MNQQLPPQGWICPRCGKVWSPAVTCCNCQDSGFTVTGIKEYPQEISKEPEEEGGEVMPTCPKCGNADPLKSYDGSVLWCQRGCGFFDEKSSEEEQAPPAKNEEGVR